MRLDEVVLTRGTTDGLSLLADARVEALTLHAAG